MADILGEVLKILAELLFKLALAIFIAIPASFVAFVYGLASGQGLSRSFALAGKAAMCVIEQV